MSQLLTNYYEAASVILFGLGFMNLLLQNNLIKKFIGLNIMDTATYLFLAAKGYVFGRIAPILTNGIIDAEYYIRIRNCVLSGSGSETVQTLWYSEHGRDPSHGERGGRGIIWNIII